MIQIQWNRDVLSRTPPRGSTPRNRVVGEEVAVPAPRTHRGARARAAHRRAVQQVAIPQPRQLRGAPDAGRRRPVEPIAEEENNRQRFALGPLDGFGHTLGNSLRRTLLSSIPGAAITQVRFDDALHEFDTIPGVVEDVTDIILNLKDIVLVSHSDEPVTLRLDVRSADITAKDIQLTSDIEILNEDLHLATLSKSGRIAVDITVSKGRGYRSADANRCPRPSASSPSTRSSRPSAAFEVEPPGSSSRPSSTGWSSTSRPTARSRRGMRWPRPATRCSLVNFVADMSHEPQGLELGELQVTSAGRPTSTCRSRTSTCPSARATASRAQVNSVGELVQKTEDDLLAITNFGQKSLDEVIAKLDERGLSLRTKD